MHWYDILFKFQFIKKITNISDKTMLSMISNIQLEDDDYDYNLSFADEKTAVDEEFSYI